MTYAVCAPEYFPRAAYVALMFSVDVFVIADTFQYSRQSFQNRARIRTPQGTQWLSIPIKGGQHGRSIDQVERDPRFPWQRKHQKAFVYNYRSAPFFMHYEVPVSHVLATDEPHLLPILRRSVQCVIQAFRPPCRIVYASDLPDTPRTLTAVAAQYAGHTLLSLADAFAYDVRQVPTAQRFDYREQVYRQNFEGFEPHLSTLDLLFNHGPDARRLVRSGIKNAEDQT
ncbi:MAG: hypothetical protein RhofKO_14840 [Rhodothermales bacterium]